MTEIKDKFNQYMRNYKEFEKNVEGIDLLIKNCEANIDYYEDEIEELDNEMELNSRADALFNNIIFDRSNTAKQEIERTLNNAFSVVPLNNTRYQAKIIEDFESKNKKIGVKIHDTNTDRLLTPLRNTGTMIAQLTSILTRIVLITLGNSRRLLVMDENISGFKDIGSTQMFVKILVELAESENFQIVMIEHKENLRDVVGLYSYHMVRDNYEEGIKLGEIIRLETETESY